MTEHYETLDERVTTGDQKKLRFVGVVILMMTAASVALMLFPNHSKDVEVYHHTRAVKELTKRGLISALNSRGRMYEEKQKVLKPVLADLNVSRASITTGFRYSVWRGEYNDGFSWIPANGLHYMNMTFTPSEGIVFVSFYCEEPQMPTTCRCSEANRGTLAISSLDDSGGVSCDCAYVDLSDTSPFSFCAVMTCGDSINKWRVTGIHALSSYVGSAVEAMSGNSVQAFGQSMKDALSSYSRGQPSNVKPEL